MIIDGFQVPVAVPETAAQCVNALAPCPSKRGPCLAASNPALDINYGAMIAHNNGIPSFTAFPNAMYFVRHGMLIRSLQILSKSKYVYDSATL
jgi:hypothetical protein